MTAGFITVTAGFISDSGFHYCDSKHADVLVSLYVILLLRLNEVNIFTSTSPYH